jgi:hypothetical protein
MFKKKKAVDINFIGVNDCKMEQFHLERARLFVRRLKARQNETLVLLISKFVVSVFSEERKSAGFVRNH